MDMTTEPLLTVKELSIAFSAGGRTTLAVDRISFSIKKGETLALVGEFGIGQVRDRAVDHEAVALSGREPSVRPGDVQGPGSAQPVREEHSRDSRRRHHHHLPGADDFAQSAAHDRAADRRNPAPASRHDRRAGACAHPRTADAGRHSQSRDAAEELSASDVRRPAPARDDRDGARQRAGSVDRRRADDRARRHRPGANP